MRSREVEKVMDFVVDCIYTFNFGWLAGFALLGWVVMR